jgi:S1-C subfamily serine protease
VADGASSLQLATWDGTDFDAQVKSISTGPDLALLSAAQSSAVGTLASGDPSVGESVWAAGYPLGDRLALTKGQVLDYVSGSEFGLPDEVMRVTNSLRPGNSGGPLLTGTGDVVGVVFGVQTSTGDGLVIPVSEVSQYLENPVGSVLSNCAQA